MDCDEVPMTAKPQNVVVDEVLAQEFPGPENAAVRAVLKEVIVKNWRLLNELAKR